MIRQRLIQRGISWEKTLEIITLLDQEDTEAGKVSLSRRGPESQSWLTMYCGLIFFGGLLVFINEMFSSAMLRCDLAGYGLLMIGLVGMTIYGVNALIARFI